VSAGGLHSCAVEASGVVKCWGRGEDGQLGHGGRSQRSEARPVPYLGLAANVSAGGSHTCVLERSGSVKCFGWGEFGQLGDGKTLDSLYPVPILGLGEVVSLCTGGLHSCVANRLGEVKCWGWGDLGQLGSNNGTEMSSPMPMPVDGIEGAVSVACGYQHTCALIRNETSLEANCFGRALDNQLQRHDEVWEKSVRRVMRLDEVLAWSAPMPTSPMRSVW
ncbi:unnamed protein product, partial [Polarella glacialis]